MNMIAFCHARDMAKNIFLYNLKHVTHEHYGVVPMFRVFSLRVNRTVKGYECSTDEVAGLSVDPIEYSTGPDNHQD